VPGHHVHRFSGAERGEINIGDSVAVFALGPIGLCAVAGARLKGATTIIGVDAVPERMSVARRLGATHVVNFKNGDVVEQIMALTDGRGVDVSIERWAPRVRSNRPCGCCVPVVACRAWGCIPATCAFRLDAFAAGLGDYSIVSTLCPGGKERMRRLMAVVRAARWICRRW
jgi:threonine dehydrogenase-like Zn-dependent dehydrogenase